MYPMLNTSLGPKSLGHLWILPDGIGERVFQIIFGPPLGIIYLLGSAHTSYMQLFLENYEESLLGGESKNWDA